VSSGSPLRLCAPRLSKHKPEHGTDRTRPCHSSCRAPPLAVVGCLDRLGCEILCGTEISAFWEQSVGDSARCSSQVGVGPRGESYGLGGQFCGPGGKFCGGGGVIGARLSLCPRSVTLAYPGPAVPYPASTVPYPSSDDWRRRRRSGATVVTPRRTTPRRIGAGPPQNEVM
jgi:hypothetical protein